MRTWLFAIMVILQWGVSPIGFGQARLFADKVIDGNRTYSITCDVVNAPYPLNVQLRSVRLMGRGPMF